MDDFVAIDFETATNYRNSACAVGIVTVQQGEIVDEYYSLIQPPGNQYNSINISIHHIHPIDTQDVPLFKDIYPEIKKRLKNKTIVAHNEAFDRGVLKACMLLYHLDYNELGLRDRWEDTVKIYRQKDYPSAKLSFCCKVNGIELDHHEALSDARACAKLYLMR